jgi:hypothetical protein
MCLAEAEKNQGQAKQELENLGMTKQGETLTGTTKRPRPESSIHPKRPRDSRGQVTYKEAVANIEIAIFKNYPK